MGSPTNTGNVMKQLGLVIASVGVLVAVPPAMTASGQALDPLQRGEEDCSMLALGPLHLKDAAQKYGGGSYQKYVDGLVAHCTKASRSTCEAVKDLYQYKGWPALRLNCERSQ